MCDPLEEKALLAWVGRSHGHLEKEAGAISDGPVADDPNTSFLGG